MPQFMTTTWYLVLMGLVLMGLIGLLVLVFIWRASSSSSRSRRDRVLDDFDDEDEREDDETDVDGPDEDHELTARPRRRHFRDLEPHRGSTILVMGIVGLVACGPLGVAAWLMGKADLEAMRQGRMDPRGESNTKAGYILGIIATVFLVLGLCFFGLQMALFLGLAAGGPGGLP